MVTTYNGYISIWKLMTHVTRVTKPPLTLLKRFAHLCGENVVKIGTHFEVISGMFKNTIRLIR
jgi:hypothetical protein